ncbi:hypothetical protein K2173_000784 [Erythroxylum novogranatense]|uniref:SWIM-type domain-containing protein n=1 Tax=Erythroxylum novogranatense TaxID=1862640 RepID=A0AAV8T4B6_9ROSI|nr:hypothetical protein K2173_000784 [Erythroxylum novogranatense]
MAAASLLQPGCAYSGRFSNNVNNTNSNVRNGASLSSTSSSSSCSCSFSQGFHFSPGSNSICKHQTPRAQAMNTATRGNLASSSGSLSGNEPDHLLVLVHGILASPSDWTYVQAELKRRLGRNFLIYASSSNSYTKTFSGIDGAGKRLAEEVMQVVRKTKSLKKISFLAHSLGGLFARYAIAVLYKQHAPSSSKHDDYNNLKRQGLQDASFTQGTIVGLEPINFITLATPHLGVRGRKQLPFLLGISFLEKLAPPLAPFFVGQTGSQLFLTDGQPNKPPLLLRMTSDCEDGQFMSALGAFRCRIVYANVSYDHMVGWRTSSIRREKELVKTPQRSLNGYQHVVDVEYCPPVSTEGPKFPPKAAKAKESAQNETDAQNTVQYHEIMEEEMIQGLQQLGWKKVDVSFHSAFWPFFAHNNIHVKNERFYNAGAGVIAHVADGLKQQESCLYVNASL